MATRTTTKPRAKAKTAGVQDKAKAVYERGEAAFADAKSFTKGNIEAIVESGKILGTGLKQLGEGYVAEGRSAAATWSSARPRNSQPSKPCAERLRV